MPELDLIATFPRIPWRTPIQVTTGGYLCRFCLWRLNIMIEEVSPIQDWKTHLKVAHGIRVK